MLVLPSLYVIALDKKAQVADVWEVQGDVGLWNLCFARNLNDGELEVVVSFFFKL